MRFKRIDICPLESECLQPSELAVMAKASSCCGCGERGVCVSEIQRNLHISKPAVSQTLNSLEKKGYVTRAIDPVDRRKITVLLTQEGEKALSLAKRRYMESLDGVLDRFGSENVKNLLYLVNGLMDILEES